MFVDSHCHLNFPEFRNRLPEILSSMAAARVGRALCICTTLEEFDSVHKIALDHDNIWCSVGVHPDNEGVSEPTVEDLLDLATRPRVVAIGETGLDYFRIGQRSLADMEWQRDRFRVHIRAAARSDLPLVVHTRSSAADTIAILKDEGAQRTGGVFHCFTEGVEVAREALDLGFYISFSGILTFKNATELHDVARFVPLNRCLIETDSPYLAPVPFRGKVNNPAYVVHVATRLAALRAIPLEDVEQATTRNFAELFGLGGRSKHANS